MKPWNSMREFFKCKYFFWVKWKDHSDPWRRDRILDRAETWPCHGVILWSGSTYIVSSCLLCFLIKFVVIIVTNNLSISYLFTLKNLLLYSLLATVITGRIHRQYLYHVWVDGFLHTSSIMSITLLNTLQNILWRLW